ncbi:MAG: hypothetical protein LBC88_08455 [Spirochaetaceae bacterium]|jgi:hypothetical protein|nr:hypothetical protein [Spirochaetaceae bacterium]
MDADFTGFEQRAQAAARLGLGFCGKAAKPKLKSGMDAAFEQLTVSNKA